MLKTSILQSVAFAFTCFFYFNTSYHTFAQTTAQGMVFIDTNKNGEQDPGEQPLPNICVSNGQGGSSHGCRRQMVIASWR